MGKRVKAKPSPLPPIVIGPCKATDGADVAEVMNQVRDREEAAMVKRMVDRFLGWRLPKPWSPDGGISYQRPNYAHPPTDSDWPTGTNLFDATQAEAMIRHMLNFPTLEFPACQDKGHVYVSAGKGQPAYCHNCGSTVDAGVVHGKD